MRRVVTTFLLTLTLMAQSLTWDRAKAEHLLNRAGFGGSPEEVDRVTRLGCRAAVEELLESDLAPESRPTFVRTPIIRRGRTDFTATRPNLPKEELDKLIQKANSEAEDQDRRQLLDFRNWWVDRMIAGETPLQEKMTLFWAGHFTSSQRDVRNSEHMILQNEFLRANALGSFRTLLHGIAKDPAMLRYLDNNKNRKGRPNENFAREVMELFTLGEGHYLEEDIKEAARAFTGWNFKGNEFALDASLHDFGQKTIFGRVGPFDGDDVLDLLVDHPESSRFLARRLLGFFVTHDPAPEWVERYAGVLRDHAFHLRPFLRTLFMDPGFYDPNVVGTRILGPVEYGVSLARRLPGGSRAPGYLIAFAAEGMGQSLLAPPNVKGWEGGDAWLTSSSLLARGNLALALSKGFDEKTLRDASVGASPEATVRIVESLRRTGQRNWQPDWISPLCTGLDPKGNMEALVDSLCDRFLGVPVTQESRALLLDYMKSSAGADAKPLPVARRIERLVHLIMSLPEAHLG